MHEFSIVHSLLDLCEAQAKKHGATKIFKVEIKVGKLSGIEPHLLETAFDTFKEKTICDGAELVMNIQELVMHCRECHHECTLEKNEFYCPKCGSPDIRMIDGEEMYLMHLEME